MFQKVDYVMVMVSDMQRSVSFYRDKLGLPLKFESKDWSEFQTGETTLALHGGGSPKPSSQGPEPAGEPLGRERRVRLGPPHRHHPLAASAARGGALPHRRVGHRPVWEQVERGHVSVGGAGHESLEVVHGLERLPKPAAIGRTEHPISSRIDHSRIVRRHRQRRIPVPAQGRLTWSGLRGALSMVLALGLAPAQAAHAPVRWRHR